MNHFDDEASDLISAIIHRLHRSGWSVGDTTLATEAGSIMWLVVGANGANRLEAAGTSRLDAWESALSQARRLGMLASE